MQVGVDIGGTFTDLVLSGPGGFRIHKVLSTPHDPAQAMLVGLPALLFEGLGAVQRITHGSTVATNAILERKGARTALITTQGFRDILAIGRQNRPELYALQPQLPAPLMPRSWCYEVPERLDPNGEILIPLELEALDAVLDDIERQGIESLAVCFLYSYVNPAHERLVRDRILSRGLLKHWQIALSSDVLPQFREYERASTVALEAYVRPVVSRYLQRLESELCPERFAGLAESFTLRIMKSDGGVMSVGRSQERAIHTVLSGPAAGVIGAFHLAQLAGYDDVITLDIGGTSTDVALCPGALVRRAESEIDGVPLRTRALDIETIGAGGGSIARLDAGGVLRVGPESAGAEPGPIAYGLGGRKVTVTDAHLVLGRVDPDYFLGGEMMLYLKPARAAVRSLGEAIEMTPEEAALGVVHVANVNIDQALRRVSIARGYDPRQFTLVAFGGAGPLHACAVADQLEIPRVLVPRHPGVLCAFGLLMADVVLEQSRSILEPVSEATPALLQEQLSHMAVQALARLTSEGVEESAIVLLGLVDARYEGQSYELTMPFDQDLVAAFHAAHAESYGHAMPDRAVEVVNLRLQATGLIAGPKLVPEPLTENDGSEAFVGEREGFLEKLGKTRLALYERVRLRPGASVAGPALVLQMDSTAFIPPSWSGRVDGYRNLVLERST
ncbi:MAG: hydantoinase/oxoprolinase family protein [Anaerolineae bacterium]|jgi:N-methylhydantoinase A